MSGALVQDATGDELVAKGQQFYDRQFKTILEPDHAGRFVAIEPDSGRYFVADTGVAALRAARTEIPGKLFYLVRIGHRAANKQVSPRANPHQSALCPELDR